MNENEWDDLFDLISKAVDLPGLTAAEKGKEIRKQAGLRDQLVNLDEFIAQAASED